MKKFITIQLITLVLLLGGANVRAEEPTYTVDLMETGPDDFDPDRRDETNRGHRMPPRPIFCVISESEGVTISTVSVEDIDTFEFYSPGGVCLGSFTDADSFVTALFSISVSTVELRFVTADSTYHGYLTFE